MQRSAGYAHVDYARSLEEFGAPVPLPKCGGYLLARRIPGSTVEDAIGCYPLFSCRDWSAVRGDLGRLRERSVSVALVADPFGNYDEELLRETFDRVVGFKSHFVVELGRQPEELASKHHRYYAKKALAKVSVETVTRPHDFLADWCNLYGNLIRRHELSGIKAFSREAFERQLQMDDLVILRAVHDGRTVGAHLWMVMGDVANSHLAAFSEEGYDLMCAYALYWDAIRHFTGKVNWLNIGAGAGLEANAMDGLTQFKRGWATGTRTAWFCASVLQPEKYTTLCVAAGATGSDYFPAYRQGELA